VALAAPARGKLGSGAFGVEACVRALAGKSADSGVFAAVLPAAMSGDLAALEALLAQYSGAGAGGDGAPWIAGGDAPSLADLVVALCPAVLQSWIAPGTPATPPSLRRLAASVLAHSPTVAAAFPGLGGARSAAPASALVSLAEGSGPDALAAAVRKPGEHPEWSADRVRSSFVEFFEARGHVAWPASPVVPLDDPTLLFVNAGMCQYKSLFLGVADPRTPMGALTRAANSQRCIRAGGKHNDLDDVGRDVYHHTLFEMLGNWSFGDFFKRESIEWSWDLLTRVYGLPEDRLYATYFEGDAAQGLEADTEARDLWLTKLPASRVLPGNAKDNFWEMGDQGPCGPASEIHYDRIGGRDAAALVNQDDPDVLEIWNLVFIQFNREPSGLINLPKRHVDTGMGLERVASILQGQRSNYMIDGFAGLFAAIKAEADGDKTRDTSVNAAGEKRGPLPVYGDKTGVADTDGIDMAYRVLADHARTLSFALTDGARPGPEGRGYVLRRVLRRAVRYGRETLGLPSGFFARLCDAFVTLYADAFPELAVARADIKAVIEDEEESFGRTLSKGLERFGQVAAACAEAGGVKIVSGADAFLLWDTYGFPVDLTELMATEKGLTVDMAAFEAELAAAKEKSRAGGKGKGGTGVGLKFQAEATGWLVAEGIPQTSDEGKYGPGGASAPSTPGEGLAVARSKVLAVLTRNGFKPSSNACPDGVFGVVLDKTTFYAEAGGQVGDSGWLTMADGNRIDVHDAQTAAGYVLHLCSGGGDAAAPAVVSVGDVVDVAVDRARRAAIAPNHTLTHVLNHALCRVLGPQVAQKGSVVDEGRLRFDFSHGSPVTVTELAEVEKRCCAAITADLNVSCKVVPLDEAKAIRGLRAVFGEAYPDPVRVVAIGADVDALLADRDNAENEERAIEFCGGTHLTQLGQAGSFVLLSEEGVAKGVRRIQAATGVAADEAAAQGATLAAKVAAAASASDDDLKTTVGALAQEVDDSGAGAVQKAKLRAAVGALQARVVEAGKRAAKEAAATASAACVEASAQCLASGGRWAVLCLADGLDAKALGAAWTEVSKSEAVAKAPKGFALALVSRLPDKGKTVVFAAATPDAAKELPAGAWAGAALSALGGKGGGKPTLAQGMAPKGWSDGAEDAAALEKAVEALQALAVEKCP